MAACFGKSCSFGWLCVFFVNLYQFLFFVFFFLFFVFFLGGGGEEFTVLFPDHYLSF